MTGIKLELEWIPITIKNRIMLGAVIFLSETEVLGCADAAGHTKSILLQGNVRFTT